MADLAAILATVSRASNLALRLYKIATLDQNVTNTLSQSAKSIINFSGGVKHLGAVIQENDTLLSPEAVEVLDDILEQGGNVLGEIEQVVFRTADYENGSPRDDETWLQRSTWLGATEVARLEYLRAHIESLRSTIAVMQQTLYTAQGIIWARVRPSISPQQAAGAVANEKAQLEILVIEQQVSLLLASKFYEPARLEGRFIQDKDSSRSLVTVAAGVPKPADLRRYRARSLTSMDISNKDEHDWLPTVCGSSKIHLERMLERWTRLQQFHDKISDQEQQKKSRKRDSQQPSVESESEDENALASDSRPLRLLTPTPRHPGSVQPLFTETNALPIPGRHGPTAPLSPASSFGASPRSPKELVISGGPLVDSPVSPRSSISSMPPIEAEAALEAKGKDDDLNLEIPWKILTRKHYWAFIDDKVKESNSDLQPSTAYADPGAWTEILASWVCHEAIKKEKHRYTQVQKEKQDTGRTKFETCFCIQQALTFNQIQRLVERTVEIYRKNQPATPPPSTRRTSLDRPSISPHQIRDRDRTPLAKPHPPLERSTTYAYPPPPPPPQPRPQQLPPILDRTQSFPGPFPSVPSFQSNLTPAQNQLPVAMAPYAGQTTSFFPQSGPYSPPSSVPYSPGTQYPLPPPFSPTNQSTLNLHAPHLSPMTTDLRRIPSNYAQIPQPLQMSRQSSSTSRKDHYSSASTDSEADAERSRKHRSKSRRPSGNSSGKKKTTGTLGTLATVGGLAALLDSIADLGAL